MVEEHLSQFIEKLLVKDCFEKSFEIFISPLMNSKNYTGRKRHKLLAPPHMTLINTKALSETLKVTKMFSVICIKFVVLSVYYILFVVISVYLVCLQKLQAYDTMER